MDNGEDRYLDITQTYFEWRVSSSGYYWDDEARDCYEKELDNESVPIELLPTVQNPPFLIEKLKQEKQESERRIYKPIESCPELFLTFAEVAPTRAGILEFANEYGHLNDFRTGATRVETPRSKSEYSTGESLDVWLKELRYMRWTVMIWEALRNEDIKSLEKIIRWSESEDEVSYILADKDVLEQYPDAATAIDSLVDPEFGFSSGPIESEYGMIAQWIIMVGWTRDLKQITEKGDLIFPAQLLLQRRINHKLEYGIIPKLLLSTKHKSLMPYLVPLDLLSSLWIEFYLVASGQKRVKRCEECGRWEDVTNRSNNWKVHGDCASARRSKRHREKKRKEKESEGGE